MNKAIEAFKLRQKYMWEQCDQFEIETDIAPLTMDDCKGFSQSNSDELTKDANTKESAKTGKEQFNDLIELFGEYKIDIPAEKDVRGKKEISFSVFGPRHSVIHYSIWGPGVVDVWFGKSDSDSGGLALQGNIYRGSRPMNNVLKLHKRFMGSGRLKILRRYNKR